MDSTKEKEVHKRYKYRICSPSGTFPEQNLKCDFGGLYISEQLLVLAWDEAIPNAQQKLLAALLMATDFNFGFLKLYLLPFEHSLAVANTKEIFNSIGNDIRWKIEKKHILPQDVFPEFDHYQNSKGASLPIALNGIPYHKVHNLINSDCFASMTKALEEGLNKESVKGKSGDLLRLADYLLRSSQLSCHFQFQQEASHYLLSALEFYQSLEWRKAHPTLNEWGSKLERGSCLELAKTISPIDYVKLYKLLLTSVKNAYLKL